MRTANKTMRQSIAAMEIPGSQGSSNDLCHIKTSGSWAVFCGSIKSPSVASPVPPLYATQAIESPRLDSEEGAKSSRPL